MPSASIMNTSQPSELQSDIVLTKLTGDAESEREGPIVTEQPSANTDGTECDSAEGAISRRPASELSHSTGSDASDTPEDDTSPPTETEDQPTGVTRSSESEEATSSGQRGTLLPSQWVQMRAIIQFDIAVVFSFIFVAYYVQQTLTVQNPTLGALLFSPSTTVAVINAMSTILVALIAGLYAMVFDAVRWQLAARERGVRLITFLSLSAATSLWAVVYLICLTGFHQVWCIQRILAPLLCLLGPIILTANINFVDVYNPIQTEGVQAGLAPLNTTLLSLIPPSDVSVYFSAWSNAILESSKFVTPGSPIACSGDNCTSIFLPGGIETARLLNGNPNSTLLNTPSFPLSAGTAILINDAPGYQIDFYQPASDFSFNNKTDCVLYGQFRGQGMYVCVGSTDLAMVVGWSVCPSSIYWNRSCSTNLTWTATLDQRIAVSLFKRYSTVAYDSRNLSILSVQSISSPQPVKPQPDLFSPILNKLLSEANSNATDDATEQTNAVLFQFGFFLRLYQDYFVGDVQGPINLLRGFITVPYQFGTAAWQLIYSANNSSSLLALPLDLQTTASIATFQNRALADPWTVYTFIAATGSMVLCATLIIFYIWVQGPPPPNTSSIGDIDLTSKCPSPGESGEDDIVQALPVLLRRRSLSNARLHDIIRAIKGWWIRVGGMVGGTSGQRSVALQVSKEAIKVGEPTGLRILERNERY